MPDDERLAIETVNLTKVFKDFWRRDRVRALDRLNLKVRKGEIFGLLGPNGSGKSTAVKLMLGLLFPTSGSVAVLGHHPRNQTVKRRIGYMPEESYLYRFLNAVEILDFYARLFNLPPQARKTRINRLLDMVGLTPHKHRPLAEYSKGMARRIGIAQALVNDPELLFLDEPTTGLDPIGTGEMKDLIRELKNRGKTVLLCSHLLSDVEDVCDRVTILYGGKVRAEGSVGELLSKQSETQITSEALPPEVVEKIETVLRDAGVAAPAVSHPTERLESFFLRVVETARKAEPVSSGATAGKAAATFWEGEEEEKEDAGEDVISRLVRPEEPEEPGEGEDGKEEVSIPAADQPPDEEPQPDVLSELVEGGIEKTIEDKSDSEKTAYDLAEEQRRKRAEAVLQQLMEQSAGEGEEEREESGSDEQ